VLRTAFHVTRASNPRAFHSSFAPPSSTRASTPPCVHLELRTRVHPIRAPSIKRAASHTMGPSLPPSFLPSLPLSLPPPLPPSLPPPAMVGVAAMRGTCGEARARYRATCEARACEAAMYLARASLHPSRRAPSPSHAPSRAQSIGVSQTVRGLCQITQGARSSSSQSNRSSVRLERAAVRLARDSRENPVSVNLCECVSE